MPGERAPDNPSAIIADHLHRAFAQRPGWEHPSMMALVEDLKPEQAVWRPAPDKRCIWELLRHLNAWRAHVARRLGGEEPEFDDPWPRLPEAATSEGPPDERARLWENQLDQLRVTQELLVDRTRNLDPAQRYPHPDLADKPHWLSTLSVQIHDSYHLGQIALLRGLQGVPPAE